MASSDRDALAEITKALIRCGHTTLDDQARALGLPRSTAWNVINAKHKLGRLRRNTTMKILSHPRLPAEIRAVVEAYSASVHAHRMPRRRRVECAHRTAR